MNWKSILATGAILFSPTVCASTIVFIAAYTDDGGTLIQEGVWQPDNTLFMVWMADDPSTPISGYSTALNAEPDCDIDTTDNSTDLGPLPDGTTVFYVRAVDEADSCGPASGYTIMVDANGDEILTLVAYTESGGMLMEEGVAQPDNTPFMAWTVAASTAPIAGYSTALNTEPDCDIDTTDNSTDLGPLPDGTTVFYVRAVDVPGNCGPTLGFEIIVFRPDDVFLDGFETVLSGLCGACVTDDDCLGPTDKCLTLDDGFYCSQDCSEGNPYGTTAYQCPLGYSCQQVEDGFHCIPDTNACLCDGSNTDLVRDCTVSVPEATCNGQQICTVIGWGSCMMPEEVCDGIDNDCDGTVDEGC